MGVQYLSKPDGQRLAYVYSPGFSPCVMFCGGYRSDMNGTKAVYLENCCRERAQAFVRFDYGGHGQSDGRFEEGLIGGWAKDALQIFDHVIQEEKVVLVGSSMGGWIAFLLAFWRFERIVGLAGIAAAPDFTEELYARLCLQEKELMMTRGYALMDNDYSDEPYHFSRAFYEEAKDHLVLGRDADWSFPVHLIQGMKDLDVLPQTAEVIQQAFSRVRLEITYVPEGDHRLSRPEDLELIDGIVWALSKA